MLFHTYEGPDGIPNLRLSLPSRERSNGMRRRAINKRPDSIGSKLISGTWHGSRRCQRPFFPGSGHLRCRAGSRSQRRANISPDIYAELRQPNVSNLSAHVAHFTPRADPISAYPTPEQTIAAVSESVVLVVKGAPRRPSEPECQRAIAEGIKYGKGFSEPSGLRRTAQA